MIPESRLDKYLQEGFAALLPNDLSIGEASVEEIVADFVTYRKSVEIVMKSVEPSSECDSHANSSFVSDHQFGLDNPSHNSSTTDLVDSDVPRSDGASSTRWRGSDEGSSMGSSNLARNVDDGDDASIHCDIDDDVSILTYENFGAGQTIIEET
jgi:hypothetical protein